MSTRFLEKITKIDINLTYRRDTVMLLSRKIGLLYRIKGVFLMKRYVLRMVVTIACLLSLTLSVGATGRAAQLPRLNLKQLDLTKGTTFSPSP